MKVRNRKQKEKIEKMREKGMTYQRIADKLGLTRQRIHQIFSERDLDEIAKTRSIILVRDAFTCQKCLKQMPPNKLVLFQPASGRNSTLCYSCRRIVAQGGLKEYCCKYCKKIFSGKEGYGTLKKCLECVVARKKMWSFKFQLSECRKCHSSKSKHVVKGVCQNCFQRDRYKTDSKFRARIAAYNLKWRTENREKYLEKMRNYQRMRRLDKKGKM